MRKTLAYLAAAGCLAMSATAAHAFDGTVMFTGKLVNASCVVNVDGSGTKTGSVKLPTVHTDDLKTPGATAGTQPFTISLAGCPSGQNVRVDFEYASGFVNQTTGNLINTGDATNVELQLLDGGTPINIGTTLGTFTPTDINGAVDFPFDVRYVAVDSAATAGSVMGTVNFSIEYQ